jgi:putative endonuclease
MFHQINELMVLGMHPWSPYLRRNRSAPKGSRDPLSHVLESWRMHFVYIVRCGDGTLYTGYARDPKKRASAHNAGRGAKYTLTRRPVCLVYSEKCSSRSAALKREYAVKSLTRAEKLTLVSESVSGRVRRQRQPVQPDQSASPGASRTRSAGSARGRQTWRTR